VTVVPQVGRFIFGGDEYPPAMRDWIKDTVRRMLRPGDPATSGNR
jgi:hypothetical protein